MKPTLSINKSDLDNYWRTLGMSEFLTYFINSNKFDITYHKDQIKTLRDFRATIVYYNDKKIYLDFWEYSAPTYTMPVYLANFDLIIKLQHKRELTYESIDKISIKKKILSKISPEERHKFIDKVVPWTFFLSRIMTPFMGKEDKIEKLPIERLGFFCGKIWRSRKSMIKYLGSKGIEIIKSSQEKRFSGRPLKDDEYIHKMITSKYGIVLRGRGSHTTEAKNRREIDYMILKKPLLLDYRPYYYNPLIEGKHYIYIDDNTDFEKIDKLYNINEIAQNGYEWYKQNASEEGVVNVFLQIMKDKFGVGNDY